MIKRSYSIPKVLALRNKICGDSDIMELIGDELRAAAFKILVDRCETLLPGKYPIGVIQQSLFGSAGRTLTEQSLKAIAWRLAGNVVRLRRGHPVPAWSRQVDDEYVPIQVLEVAREYYHYKPYGRMTARALAGTPAGLILERTWSCRFYKMLSQRLGFSKPWKETPYRHTSEYSGLRFYVLISADQSVSAPFIDGVWLTDDESRISSTACLQHNKELILLRKRPRGVFDCPWGYTDPVNQPCYRCAAGWCECDAAVHALTYVMRLCPICGKESLFDPSIPDREHCIQCADRRLRQGE